MSAPLAALLADRAEAWRRAHGAGLVVGVSGPQGSGKSTACAAAVRLLEARGLRAATLSLDDLYLPRAERLRMAREVHPLFATRGPPGTHDVELGLKLLTAVRRGEAASAPRFDKRTDDRAAEGVMLPADLGVVLFEGWCLGIGAAPAEEPAAPLNALERREDADGRWRARIEAALAGPYAKLWSALDRLVVLAAPDWDTVRGWRIGAEPEGGMDAAALDRFLEHYERLTRRAAGTLPRRADVMVSLDANRAAAPL